MKYYKIMRYLLDIKEIDVERETAQALFLGGPGGLRRVKKNSELAQHFTTWEEAYSELERRVRSKLERAQQDMEKLQSMLTEKQTSEHGGM